MKIPLIKNVLSVFGIAMCSCSTKRLEILRTIDPKLIMSTSIMSTSINKYLGYGHIKLNNIWKEKFKHVQN